MTRKRTNPKPASRGSSPGDKLLRRVAAALDRAEVAYVVIGGQAVNQHGHHRFTRDIDLTLHVGPWDAQRIIDIAARLRLRVMVDAAAAFVSETQVLPCEDDRARMGVDFSFVLSDYVRQAIARAPAFKIAGYPVKFLAVDDLLLQKVIANRPQDRIDVVELLARHSNVDRAYITTWLSEFESVLDEKLIERFNQLAREV